MPGMLPDVVFLGAGEFGLPTLRALADAGRVALVVSQPDRESGRGKRLAPTPISAFALERGLPLVRPADCNGAEAMAEIRATAQTACHGACAAGRAQPAPCFVVIAYGQKLSAPLLEGIFAINLHGSLLPRWRGAAPIQRALMEGDQRAGVTVISLAERMDAGLVYAERSVEVGPRQTAGELHDALSALGPEVVTAVLQGWMSGTLTGRAQAEADATRARKLARADAWVDVGMDAQRVRARINGLNPWPGCGAVVEGRALMLRRAEVAGAGAMEAGAVEAGSAESRAAGTRVAQAMAFSTARPAPGTLFGDGTLWCGSGAVRLIEVQAPGGMPMAFEAWARGARLPAQSMLGSAPPVTGAAPAERAP